MSDRLQCASENVQLKIIIVMIVPPESFLHTLIANDISISIKLGDEFQQ